MCLERWSCLAIGHWATSHQFVVCSLTTVPVLGADFLSGHKMSVDLKEDKLHWAEGQVKLRTPGTRNKCYAVLMEDVRLDGNTRVVVSAEVVRGEIHCGNDIVFESDVWRLESEEQLQKTGAIAARAVVNVDSGTVSFQIMSLGTTVELPKGTKIAAIERAMVQNTQTIAAVGTDQTLSTSKSGKSEEQFKQLMSLFDWSKADLAKDDKRKMESLLWEYRELFVMPETGISGLGRTNVTKHVIKTSGASPIKQQPRRVPHAVREEVERQVEHMLDAGVIRPSNSLWSSPLVLVKKRDGSVLIIRN